MLSSPNEPQNGSDAAFVALVTCASDENARAIARALVERRLAACVNVLPGLTSIYRWQGEIHEDSERMLVIKSVNANLEAVRETVLALHDYETPEFIALPIVAGSAAYLQWLVDSCAPGPPISG